jgi:hypothetical protein
VNSTIYLKPVIYRHRKTVTPYSTTELNDHSRILITLYKYARSKLHITNDILHESDLIVSIKPSHIKTLSYLLSQTELTCKFDLKIKIKQFEVN